MGKVYVENPNLRRCESKRRFMLTMIESLWDLYDLLWKHRCEVVHNNTDINALSVLEVDRRIRFLFDHNTSSSTVATTTGFIWDYLILFLCRHNKSAPG